MTDILATYPKPLTELEQKIIKARTSGLSFSQLEGNAIRVATDQIILRGSAICGCPLPQTEGFAQIISDELEIFICQFGYGELTLDEILLAIRLNARANLKFPSGVEVEQVVFVGHCINIDFISKILSHYSAFRRLFDGKLINHHEGYE